jgi:hypothetical protein
MVRFYEPFLVLTIVKLQWTGCLVTISFRPEAMCQHKTAGTFKKRAP